MLHDPARHEPLRSLPWDADRARETIEHIVRDTERRFEASGWWPLHPRDADDTDKAGEPNYSLYFGAAGVVWALDYLHAVGAAPRRVEFGLPLLQQALERNQAWLRQGATQDESASYLMGDTPLLMMLQGRQPTPERADRLAALIDRNIEHPAREILWGAPGTMLAALHLHERFGADDPRWAALFRRSAARLWAQRLWSDEHGCHYWTQDMYGRCSTYIDAVHGFAGTAYVALRGAQLLPAPDRAAWQDMIVDTVVRTATREDGRASWRTALDVPAGQSPRMLMQYCHGAPGFVINLAGMPPDSTLDALLLEAGEATWHAGPLTKGSNLCHGTGGNGYAFLRLWERTGDPMWLQRARAFAMHGIAQMHADEQAHGQQRYSLWTGDPGFAIYLWDCLRGRSAFPTLDVFWPRA
jgi:Lanthionine synthetase C-like protein